jgi:hypothetical protein
MAASRYRLKNPQSTISLYLLQQMTAKRLDPMTPKAHDAKLDES